MKTVLLNTLFDIKHGTKLDFNKMSVSDSSTINFVSRQQGNLGVFSRVDKIDNITPISAGTITVSLGGSYLLSAFVQEEEFYTAQNIKILTPKTEMDFNTKAFYCMCITDNRYRYSSHGREANRTLDFIPVPDRSVIPQWVCTAKIEIPNANPLFPQETPKLDTSTWKEFRYDEIFEIQKGFYNKKPEETLGIDSTFIPFIGATEYSNGITSYHTQEQIKSASKDGSDKNQKLSEKIFNSNCITVSNNGSVGRAFYQEKEFTCSHDVNPLYLKNKRLNKHIAMFLCSVIELEQYRWNYGRKWRPMRMPDSIIKLPVDTQGNPDWDYMENYIKTLPYSASI